MWWETPPRFSRWPGVVIFKGARYEPAAGLSLPRSYLPTMIALTVPVPVLVLAAIRRRVRRVPLRHRRTAAGPR